MNEKFSYLLSEKMPACLPELFVADTTDEMSIRDSESSDRPLILMRRDPLTVSSTVTRVNAEPLGREGTFSDDLC